MRFGHLVRLPNDFPANLLHIGSMSETRSRNEPAAEAPDLVDLETLPDADAAAQPRVPRTFDAFR